jgi:hypothetical protein
MGKRKKKPAQEPTDPKVVRKLIDGTAVGESCTYVNEKGHTCIFERTATGHRTTEIDARGRQSSCELEFVDRPWPTPQSRAALRRLLERYRGRQTDGPDGQSESDQSQEP